MNIGKQHFLFKDRAGVTNGYNDLLPYQIDTKLNEATSWIINIYTRKSAESQLVKDVVSPFIEPYDFKFKEIEKGKKYEVELPENYIHLERLTYVCGENESTIDIVKFDDLSKSLSDSFQKPNKVFNQSIGVIRGNKVIVYTDQELTEGHMEYLRKPKEVFFGGYDTIAYTFCNESSQGNCDRFNKRTDDPVNSELSSHYQDLQVDMAVWLATGQTNNSLVQRLINNKLQTIQ